MLLPSLGTDSPMTTAPSRKGSLSRLYRSVRPLLAVAAITAGTLVALWLVWRGWSWGMPALMPAAPTWFSEPGFGWFVAAWLVPDLLFVVVLFWRLRLPANGLVAGGK
jgi:hypothetical protein